MSPRSGVIADDFTGACDVGVQFTKAGLETVVLADAESLAGLAGVFDVVVVDTESRSLGPELAYGKVRDALKALTRARVELVYKKIDSTCRGNLGAELDAVMDELGIDAVVVAPSFLAQNRTTVDGHLLVSNMPLEGTEFALDPLNVLKESYIPTLIGRQTRRVTGRIGLPQIRSGADSLEHGIQGLVERGIQIIVADAETEDDLAKIAAASIGANALPCGSAGLAEHISRLLMSRSRLLVIAGSLHSAAIDQIAVAERKLGVKVLEPCLSEVSIDNGDLSVAVGDIVGGADEALAERKDVIICLGRSKEPILKLYRSGEELGMSSHEVKERLLSVLSESFERIVEIHRFAGLILVGGDTSARIMDALGAMGIRVEDEVLPGIPMGRILGGKHEGMRVVTKAGGFGDRYTLVNIIEHLRSAAPPS